MYEKKDSIYWGGKGFIRYATQKVKNGWLHASVWLDNIFVFFFQQFIFGHPMIQLQFFGGI